MKGIFYLAWRYLAYNRWKTSILVGSIMLIIYLPVGLNVVVEESGEHLMARAEATPLLVGAKGSPLELVLNSLYFSLETPELMDYAAASSIIESGLAKAIPLYVRFRSREQPIVGTSIEYFGFRDLQLASGRLPALLGECVLGAAAALELGVAVGDSVVSSPETAFDLAGIYPLKMSVVGLLAPNFTPDDDAIFIDVKTAWVIEGLGHGHQDLARPEAASAVLRRSEDGIVANASIVQFNEISENNIDTFHFHGDLGGYPLTAVVAVPNDQKSGVILMGRYVDGEAQSQIIRPNDVVDDLLDTILTIQQFIVAAVIIVAIATIATAALVFLLSLRLRRREIDTIGKIGGGRWQVASMLLTEVVIVLILGSSLALGLTVLTWRYGSTIIERFVLT
jgi:putative ABC transport system permease protein